MASKKELTIEELTKACEEAKKNFDTLSEQLKKAQEEEEERRAAELALQQEKRLEEVEASIKETNKLITEYVKDYGTIRFTSKTDDYDWYPSLYNYRFWR